MVSFSSAFHYFSCLISFLRDNLKFWSTIKNKPLKKEILRKRNHGGNDDNAGLNAPYHVATGNAIYIGRTETLSFTLSSPGHFKAGLTCKCANILTDTLHWHTPNRSCCPKYNGDQIGDDDQIDNIEQFSKVDKVDQIYQIEKSQ